MKPKGLCFTTPEKVEKGVDIELVDAVFTIQPIKDNPAYQAAYFTAESEFGKDLEQLENNASKAHENGRHEEYGRLSAKIREAKRKIASSASAALVSGWSIEESAGQSSKDFIGYFLAKFPECVSGKLGSRVAKYSKDAAKIMCLDKYLRVDCDEATLTFAEWISHQSGTKAVEKSTEDFAFLEESLPASKSGSTKQDL